MIGKILNNVQNKLFIVKLQELFSLISGFFAIAGGILIAYSMLTDASLLFSMTGQISVAFSMIIFGLMHHIRGEDDLYHAEMIGAVSIAALSAPPLLPSGLLENIIIAMGVVGMASSVAYIYYFYVMPEIKSELGIK